MSDMGVVVLVGNNTPRLKTPLSLHLTVLPLRRIYRKDYSFFQFKMQNPLDGIQPVQVAQSMPLTTPDAIQQVASPKESQTSDAKELGDKQTVMVSIL